MPKTEAQWEAESDADTLVRAEEIRKDPKRKKAAAAVLKERLAATQEAAAKK